MGLLITRTVNNYCPVSVPCCKRHVISAERYEYRYPRMFVELIKIETL